MTLKHEPVFTYAGDSESVEDTVERQVKKKAKTKPFRAKSLRITTHKSLGPRVNVEHLNRATILKDIKRVIDSDQIKAAKESENNLFVITNKLEANKALMLARTVEYNGFTFYVIPSDRYLAYEDDKVILGASTNAHGSPIILPVDKYLMYTQAAYQEFKLTEEMLNETW